jgi:aminopeptidase N
MTDIIWSLRLISKTDLKQKQEALNEFCEKWKNDKVVINKWFSLNSSSCTLEEVKQLEKNKLFDITNPNNVRALFNNFANWNKNFHIKDGSSYEFIANKVIELDLINPIIASRLLKFLIDWKKLESVRSNKMKKELERVWKTENLSPDVEEIVRKWLV